jgi:hypothetical protein
MSRSDLQMGAAYAVSRAVIARYSSMKSMDGITVARFGVP